MDRTKLDTILAKHGLVLVENRYLRGKDHKDGTIGWDAVVDSVFFNNILPETILAEVGKLLNLPKVVMSKKKK